jgi:Lrp/AsnC family leucine-responsive transcriptional regulator
MIDQTDLEILKILQENARTTNSEISERIGMAPSATLERTRKLERQGIIKDYLTRLDPDALGYGLIAFVHVRTDEKAGESTAAQKLIDIPEVLELYNVAGEDCYLLKMRTKNTDAYGKTLREKIGAIPEVVSTRSTIVLETYKETLALPLDSVMNTQVDD